MKKVYYILSCLLISLLIVRPVLATPNTYSIDLELSSSQYLSITDAAQTGLGLTGDFTLQAWLNFETLPSANGYEMKIISKGISNTAYFWRIGSDDLMHVRYFDGGGNVTTADTNSAAITSGELGTWIHYKIKVDVSVPSITMYKNGSSIGVTMVYNGATSIRTNTEDFIIGALNTPTEFFDGKIDEVRVYNALVDDDYTVELVGNEANLQGYWQFDNDLLDMTANNNDLTNNNSAIFSTSVPFSGDTPTIVPRKKSFILIFE